MKKFLFTLFALLMAGSAMAATHSYLYVADMTIPAEQNVPGQMIQVFVKASFDARVSAFDMEIALPEDAPLLKDGNDKPIIRPGDDLTISWTDFFGTVQTATAGLQGNAYHCIGTHGSNGYEDGSLTSYGVAKWEAGEYENMYSFYLVVPEGGLESFSFTTSSAVSAGNDTRGGCVDAAQASERIVNTTTITVEQPAQAAPVATITKEGNVVTAAVPNDTENHNVELYIVTTDPETGEEVLTLVVNPYTVPQTFAEQTITFRAKTIANNDESGDTWSNDVEITIDAKEDNQCPQPEWAYYEVVNEVWARVEYYGAAPYTEYVDLYIVTTNDQGEEVLTPVDNPYTDLPTENNTYEDIVVKFKAIVRADGEVYNINNEGYYTVTIPGKEKDYAPTPKINNDGTVVTAAVENDNPEAPHTVVLEYWNAETEEWVVVEDGSYELPEPTFETQTIKFRAYTKKNGEYYDSPYCDEVTVTIDPKDSKKAPAPTFRVDGDKLYAEQGDLTVELYKKNDDGTWTKVDNPYEGLPTENTSYTDPIVIEFKAITLPDGVTYNLNSDEVPYTYELAPLTKKTANKPTIEGANLTDATYDIVITPDPNTDGALEYTVNPAAPGKAAAETLTYERKDADYTVHVEAWTNEGPTYKKSEVAKADIVIPAKAAPVVLELPDPEINVTNDAENQTTIITIEVPEDAPEGTVLNYTLTDEEGKVIPETDYTVAATESKIVITIPNGNETAFVTVTATTTLNDEDVPEDVDVVEPGEATKTVEVPQYQKTAAPTIDVSFGGEDGAHYANVTFANNDDKPAVIEYSLDGGQTWNTYTPGVPVVITTYGETTVLARATAEGKATSDVTPRAFTLNDDATSVNELVNGKTVAGVRYFNMAGQEMQEANGITIVVTTYTDGTTSAVKVMK